MCEKITFTHTQARDALSQIKAMVDTARNRNGRLNRKKIEKRIYYCSYCKGWHLTSQNKS